MLFKFVANRTAARLKQAPIAFRRVTWACSKRAPARHSRTDNQLQLFAVAGARIQGLCPCSRQKIYHATVGPALDVVQRQRRSKQV